MGYLSMRKAPAPDCDDDRQELVRLDAPAWMVETLSLNPGYVWWGPYEDYMACDSENWEGRVALETWRQFAGWRLDSLNECVNFYFEIRRSTRKCHTCGGDGYSARARQLNEDWYDFAGAGRRWCDKLTQDEVDALVAAGRLSTFYPSHEAWVAAQQGEAPRPKLTAEEVNRRAAQGFLHDDINRSICVRVRLERQGFEVCCSECGGEGCHVKKAPAHLALVLWWLHPRKGCSRGIDIKRIEQAELGEVYAFLARAAKRNAKRFAKVVALAEGGKAS